MIAVLPFPSMIAPGAVPLRFSSTVQPRGIIACLRFDWHIGRFMPPKYASMARADGSCISSGRPNQSGDRLLAEVVVGGAETARRDDDVVARERLVERLAQAFGVVADRRVAVDVDPQLRQPPGDHLGVGVDDVAEQDLGSDTEDFRRF